MRESFEALQASAIGKLTEEGKTDVVGTVEEALQLLLEGRRSAVTVVLEPTNILDSLPRELSNRGIQDPKVKAWSRGNLPGVLVYEIEK